jgi:hypothetical protein
MYQATRICKRFFEYTGLDEFLPGDDFNIDATPHTVTIDEMEFDSMRELIDAVKRDYVRFDATGNDWAADPDGSQIIEYARAEREAISWHFDNIPERLLNRVLIPSVDTERKDNG